MNAAILILAHDQPAHFARLVASLRCDWARMFVHIDRKSNLTEFTSRVPARPDIQFLAGARRVRVAWGGFSQVRATLNLVSAALQSGETFDRFCLLSGSHFPIKRSSDIAASFDSNREFIRVDRRVSGAAGTSHCDHVRYFHFADSRLLRRARLSGRVRRRVYDKVPLYQGAQWWALTRGCVDYVLEFLRDNPELVRFTRWTLLSDEILFHSIVKVSPFAANVTHDFETAASYVDHLASNDHGCTYVDWNAVGVRLPKVLTADDYASLMRSQCLFARKFDEPRSAELRSMLERVNAVDHAVSFPP